jgi:hypothetical protein
MTITGTTAARGQAGDARGAGGISCSPIGHPILTVGAWLELTGSEIGDRIRYERAWVCSNTRCDYRELVRGD